MNFFGTFAYGNILKTFIPGIFFVLAFSLLIDDYNYWLTKQYLIFDMASSKEILTIGLIIPLSIFAGIIANSICFKFIIPTFIEEPFIKKNQSFINYKIKIIKEMQDHYKNILNISSDITSEYYSHIDIRSFLLNRKNLNNLQYLRESYWYYMEFQINSIVAISLLIIAGIINILLRFKADATAGNLVFPYIIVTIISAYILFKIFWSAAKENYNKHEKKSLSYLQGAYHVCRYGSPTQE